MFRIPLFALAVFGWALTTTEVFALGSDHPKGPVSGSSVWPAGLVDLANRDDRVHGFWVNSTDVFFYDNDSKALNQFLDDCAKLKGTAVRVVLHPGTKKARSPWDQADRESSVAWSIQGSTHAWQRAKPQPAEVGYHIQIDVWLGSRVQLDQLRVPASIEVASGGEIEKFIADRQKKPE